MEHGIKTIGLAETNPLHAQIIGLDELHGGAAHGRLADIEHSGQALLAKLAIGPIGVGGVVRNSQNMASASPSIFWSPRSCIIWVDTGKSRS